MMGWWVTMALATVGIFHFDPKMALVDLFSLGLWSLWPPHILEVAVQVDKVPMVDHCIHPRSNTPYQPFPSMALAYLDSLPSFNAFLFNSTATPKESPSLLFYQQSLHFPLRRVSSLSLSGDLCLCPPVLVTLLCHHNPLKLCATCTTNTVFQPHANILSWET